MDGDVRVLGGFRELMAVSVAGGMTVCTCISPLVFLRSGTNTFSIVMTRVFKLQISIKIKGKYIIIKMFIFFQQCYENQPSKGIY